MAEAAQDWQSMGEGPIPRDRLAEELRPIRHNVRNLISRQDAQAHITDTALQIASKAREVAGEAKVVGHKAEDVAVRALEHVASLEHDIYGNPNRPDDHGLRGELVSALASVRSQNKLILGLLVTVIVGILAMSAVLMTASLPLKH